MNSVNCYEQIVLSKFHTKSNVILCGDFNINLFNPLSLNIVNSFIDLMFSYNFISLINSPTKFNSNNILSRFSLIDHIWTNFCLNQVKSGVICDAISDHFQIFMSFSVKIFIENSFTSFRIYNEEYIEKC